MSDTYVKLSPFGLKNQLAAAKATTTIRPIIRDQLLSIISIPIMLESEKNVDIAPRNSASAQKVYVYFNAPKIEMRRRIGGPNSAIQNLCTIFGAPSAGKALGKRHCALSCPWGEAKRLAWSSSEDW